MEIKETKIKKEHVENLVKQISDAWEIKTPIVKFLSSNYLDNTLGIAFLCNKIYKNSFVSEEDVIVLNDILLSDYSFDEILQVIYHELAHLFTRKTDNDYEFELFCKLNNIPLSGDW